MPWKDFNGSDGPLGYGPLLRDYVYFLMAKLAFHRQHPEFNGQTYTGASDRSSVLMHLPGLFEYEEYISLKSINDPNEGYVPDKCCLVELLTVVQVRDHLRPYDPPRPNRLFSEAHLCTFSRWCEQ